MRIDYQLKAYYDILWFACDLAGNIIVANSNEGNIPEFVEADRERTEWLAKKLCHYSAIDRQRSVPIDYHALAQMGFYCFANDDPYDGSLYRFRAKPQSPRLLDSLDEDVKQLLLLQRLPMDVAACDCFVIQNEGKLEN